MGDCGDRVSVGFGELPIRQLAGSFRISLKDLEWPKSGVEPDVLARISNDRVWPIPERQVMGGGSQEAAVHARTTSAEASLSNITGINLLPEKNAFSSSRGGTPMQVDPLD